MKPVDLRPKLMEAFGLRPAHKVTFEMLLAELPENIRTSVQEIVRLGDAGNEDAARRELRNLAKRIPK
jgi:hypothetical protein